MVVVKLKFKGRIYTLRVEKKNLAKAFFNE